MGPNLERTLIGLLVSPEPNFILHRKEATNQLLGFFSQKVLHRYFSHLSPHLCSGIAIGAIGFRSREEQMAKLKHR
jgi:hypothetical protein